MMWIITDEKIEIWKENQQRNELLCVFDFEFLLPFTSNKGKKLKAGIWVIKCRKQPEHELSSWLAKIHQWTPFHSTAWLEFKAHHVCNGSPYLSTLCLTLPSWGVTETHSIKVHRGLQLSIRSFLTSLPQDLQPIIHAKLQSQRKVHLANLVSNLPSNSQKLPGVKERLWSSSPARGRDAGDNPATVFNRGITCEMPVQCHSILIMCQACRFFLEGW